MKKNTKKILTAVLAILLVVALLAPVLSMLMIPAEANKEADLKNEISGLKSDATGLKNEEKDLRNQLSAIRGDKSKALEQKSLLEEQIDIIEQQIDNLNSQIEEYNKLVSIKEEELVAIQAREEEQYELFCQRVRAMEESGTSSFWAVIFNAEDFADLLDRMNMVNEIMDYDRAVIEALKSTQAELALAKEDLEGERAEREAAKAEQQGQQDELTAREAEVDALVAQIRSDERAVERAIQAVEAEAAKLDKEIAAKQKELEALIAAGKLSFVAGNGFIWPLSSNYLRISSRYGTRTHPVTGKKGSFHGGIDIPAPQNTKIYAARGGVVTISTRNSSYGNYVVVLHDNGMSTCYAHMNSRAVKVNDVVSQGQVLGYVGSTGSSTGNHLHFEIRKNGSRVNPVQYYPNVKYYYTD